MVTISPATGTRPAKNVTFPVADTEQSTPSPAIPTSRVAVAPPGGVLVTHAEPLCVTRTEPTDPLSATLSTAAKVQVAGDAGTTPSYSTVAGVFAALPRSIRSKTTAMGAATSPPPKLSSAPSTRA